MKAWLSLLGECGIDLEKYGETENAMYQDYRTKWNFGAEVSGYWETIQITQIWIGKMLDDFYFYVELEDLYFTTYLVADFWLWVEDPLDEDIKVQEIPGAWPED